MSQMHQTPPTRSWGSFDCDVVNDDALDLEVFELCLVNVILFVERDRDFVDYAMTAGGGSLT